MIYLFDKHSLGKMTGKTIVNLFLTKNNEKPDHTAVVTDIITLNHCGNAPIKLQTEHYRGSLFSPVR